MYHVPLLLADKPLIECYDTLISFIHQTNVNITCRVIARPKPDKIFFYYYLKGTNATIELQAGQSQGHYRGEIHNGDVSHLKYIFLLSPCGPGGALSKPSCSLLPVASPVSLCIHVFQTHKRKPQKSFSCFFSFLLVHI